MEHNGFEVEDTPDIASHSVAYGDTLRPKSAFTA